MVRHNAATLVTIMRGMGSALPLACIHQPILLIAKGSAPLGHGRFRFDR